MSVQEDNQELGGCIKSFLWLILGLLIFPCVVYALLIFVLQEKVDIVWHDELYYLQQDISTMEKSGYGLYLSTEHKKQLILPHVYGYARKDNFVYLAAAQGYAVINSKEGIANIILLSEKIPQIKTESIYYQKDWKSISYQDKEILFALPHELGAYKRFIDDPGSYSKTVGDCRFQYEYAKYSDTHIEQNLEVWGLYGNFDTQDTLLPDVTGYLISNNTEIMYFTSTQGYAIVDGLSSTCRVYFTNSDLAGKDYHEDIQVLDSYEDFTPEEQGILERVEKEGLP